MSAIWIEKEEPVEIEFELIVPPPEIVFSYSTLGKDSDDAGSERRGVGWS